MAEPDIRRLIEASSLGTPEARALRDSVSDEVARRIVERSEQIRVAIDAATPCLAPDVSHYARQVAALTGNWLHTIHVPARLIDTCDLWYCPTSGDVECARHGGFDVCCDRTVLHRPIVARQAEGAGDAV